LTVRFLRDWLGCVAGLVGRALARLRLRVVFALVVMAIVSPCAIGTASADADAVCRPWRQVSTPAAFSRHDIELAAVAVMPDSEVWVAGSNRVNGARQPFTARWNGKRWTVVETPRVGVSGRLVGIARIPGTAHPRVWAVGSYTSGRGQQRTLVLRWTARGWVRVPSPNVGPASNELRGVTASSKTDVLAVGSYSDPDPDEFGSLPRHSLILRWNGVKWTTISPVVPSPSPLGEPWNYLDDVVADGPGRTWAVGAYATTFTTEDDAVFPLSLRWNGSEWGSVPTPWPIDISLLEGVDTLSGRNVWAVGYGLDAGGERQAIILHLESGEWQQHAIPDELLVSPGPGLPRSNGLHAVAAVSANKVWAVGFHGVALTSDAESVTERPMILRWNGSRWKQASFTLPVGIGGNLVDVAASPGPGPEWAVGTLGNQPLVMRHC
jgi:hypothetical protein